MRTRRIPGFLIALASVASVGTLYAQQTQTPSINQRDAASSTVQSDSQTKMHAGGMPLKQVIVHKLLKANDSEIELANIALQRSENPEVQQFAKMLVQDHQAMNQKLQGMRDSSIPATRASTTTAAAGNPTTRGSDAANLDATNNRNRQPAGSATDVQSATDRQSATTDRQSATTDRQSATTDRPGTTDRQPADAQARTERGQRNRNADRGSANLGGADGAMVPQQLTQIMDQACDTSLQMTKDMLQKHQGQDFSMAFLGYQTVAHTMMLAELQAIQSQGPEELKSIAQEAAGKVEQHLAQAEQLIKKLEDDRGATRSASRK